MANTIIDPHDIGGHSILCVNSGICTKTGEQLDDMARGARSCRDVVEFLHRRLPIANEEDMLKALMVLYRGALNPSEAKRIISDAFSD